MSDTFKKSESLESPTVLNQLFPNCINKLKIPAITPTGKLESLMILNQLIPKVWEYRKILTLVIAFVNVTFHYDSISTLENAVNVLIRKQKVNHSPLGIIHSIYQDSNKASAIAALFFFRCSAAVSKLGDQQLFEQLLSTYDIKSTSSFSSEAKVAIDHYNGLSKTLGLKTDIFDVKLMHVGFNLNTPKSIQNFNEKGRFVTRFKFESTWIVNNPRNNLNEIHRQIHEVEKMIQQELIWHNPKVSIKDKLLLFELHVKPLLMRDMESKALNRSMKRKIDVCERKILRFILGIQQDGMISDEDLYFLSGQMPASLYISLRRLILRRKFSSYPSEHLTKIAMELNLQKIEGLKRHLGRPLYSFDQTIEDDCTSLQQYKMWDRFKVEVLLNGFASENSP